MAKQQKKLGEILVEWGILTPKDQQKAVDHAKAKNVRLGEALLELKLCSENNVYKALAAQHNMEYIELDKASVSPNAVGLIPDELMKKHLILPLGLDNGKLRIAIHDPLDLETVDILRFRLNKEIRTVLAPKNRIKRYLEMTCSAPARTRRLTRPSTG
jgi:type IV pilus assembly protein PilB